MRAKCVRVNGIDNQSHVIRVQGVTDAQDMRNRIASKLNIHEPHDLFVASNVDKSSCSMF